MVWMRGVGREGKTLLTNFPPQGEHGTPLHEAAMFGKEETVKMLLDKGASIEAKDRASKSVLEALREFPAGKAKEIMKIIEGTHPLHTVSLRTPQ